MMKRTLIGLVLAAAVLITTDGAFAQCFQASGSCQAGPETLASSGFGCQLCLQCPFGGGFCTLHVSGSSTATLGVYNVSFGNPRFNQSCNVIGTGCSVDFTRSLIFPGEPVPIGCHITAGLGIDASVACSASLN